MKIFFIFLFVLLGSVLQAQVVNNPATQTYTNLQQLTLIKGTNGASVKVLGGTTPGDGGGGQFYWDASSTATPVAGKIIQTNGVATGRWVVITYPWYTVGRRESATASNGHRNIVNYNSSIDTSVSGFSKTLPNFTYTSRDTGLVLTKTGTPTVFSDHIDDTLYNSSMSDGYTETLIFKALSKTSTPLNIGIGTTGTQTLLGYSFKAFASLSTAGTTALQTLHVSGAGSQWTKNSGSTVFSYTPGDILKLQLIEKNNGVTPMLSNLNTGQVIKFSIQYAGGMFSDWYPHSMGKFAIFPQTSDIQILSFTVTNDYDYADVVILGTSLDLGIGVVDQENKRFMNICQKRSPLKWANCSRQAAFIQDHVKAMKEILGYKPRYAILNYYTNDYLAGDLTLSHNLEIDMAQKLKQHGITPIHMIPLPRDDIQYDTAIGGFIKRTFPNDIIFDMHDYFDSSGFIKQAYYESDVRIHLNDVGTQVQADTFQARMPFLFNISGTTSPQKFVVNYPGHTLNNMQHTITAPLTGNTITLVTRQNNIISPAGTIAALTINLPNSPVDNDAITVTTTQTITTIIWAGGTVVGHTTSAANTQFTLTFDAVNNKWF